MRRYPGDISPAKALLLGLLTISTLLWLIISFLGGTGKVDDRPDAYQTYPLPESVAVADLGNFFYDYNGVGMRKPKGYHGEYLESKDSPNSELAQKFGQPQRGLSWENDDGEDSIGFVDIDKVYIPFTELGIRYDIGETFDIEPVKTNAILFGTDGWVKYVSYKPSELGGRGAFHTWVNGWKSSTWNSQRFWDGNQEYEYFQFIGDGKSVLNYQGYPVVLELAACYKDRYLPTATEFHVYVRAWYCPTESSSFEALELGLSSLDTIHGTLLGKDGFIIPIGFKESEINGKTRYTYVYAGGGPDVSGVDLSVRITPSEASRYLNSELFFEGGTKALIYNPTEMSYPELVLQGVDYKYNPMTITLRSVGTICEFIIEIEG